MQNLYFTDWTEVVSVRLHCEDTGITAAIEALLDPKVSRREVESPPSVGSVQSERDGADAELASAQVAPCRRIELIVPGAKMLPVSCMLSPTEPLPLGLTLSIPDGPPDGGPPQTSLPDALPWKERIWEGESTWRKELLGVDPASGPGWDRDLFWGPQPARSGGVAYRRPTIFIFFPCMPCTASGGADGAAGVPMASPFTAVLTSVLGGLAWRRTGPVRGTSGILTPIPSHLHLYAGGLGGRPEAIAVSRVDGWHNEWTTSLLSSAFWVGNYLKREERSGKRPGRPSVPNMVEEAQKETLGVLPSNFVPIVEGRGWFCQTPAADIYLMPSAATPEDFVAAAKPLLAFSGLCRESNRFVGAFRDAVRQVSLRPPPDPGDPAGDSERIAWGANTLNTGELSSLVWESGSLVDTGRRLLVAAKARYEPVLLWGETGSGKELAAAAIHCLSGSKGPLIAVNCACIPGQLAASILFGHEEGAFTGAMKRTDGILQKAVDGTLLLDEIHHLPAEVRMMMLRVLQDGKFTRLGGTEILPVERLRIVAATNSDDFMMGREQWESGLLERFRHIIWIPPLRDRPQDIPRLVELFVGQALRAIAPDLRPFKDVRRREVKGLTRECLQKDWARGNIRELQNHVAAWFWHLVCERHFTKKAVTAEEVLGFVGLAGEDGPPPPKPGRPRKVTDEELLKMLRSSARNGRTKADVMQTAGMTVQVPRRIRAIADSAEKEEARRLWDSLPSAPKTRNKAKSGKATTRRSSGRR